MKINYVKKKSSIIVGKIKSVYGILGWMKIDSFTEIKKNIFNYQPWFIKKKQNLLNLETWKKNKKNFLIKIIEINNRSEATKIINQFIMVEEKVLLPYKKKKEYYWKDILNCTVFNINLKILGIVVNIIETGNNDVLIINSHKKKNKKEVKILIPFIEEKIIKNVNIQKKIILVKWNLI
ncbi:Ribosome maturation factor RimM [Buchnera aphidicola (Tetraneura ulmi)]|uniref:ribosome maturation factor RimM n=1 Tax=Buchnera aphidicola TaxID=9 RepID=UPI0034642C4A